MTRPTELNAIDYTGAVALVMAHKAAKAAAPPDPDADRAELDQLVPPSAQWVRARATLAPEPELCEGCDAPAAWTYDEYGPELRADAERRGAMVAPVTAWCDACHDAATTADPEAWAPLPERQP